LSALGIEYEQRGDITLTRNYFSQALEISRQTGNRVAEATFLGNLGWLERCVYNFNKSVNLTKQSLVIMQEVGERLGELGIYGNLGWLYFYLGEYEVAIGLFEQAKEIANQIDYLDYEVGLLAVLIERYSQLGDFDKASVYLNQLMTNWYEMESFRDKSYFYLHLSVYMNLIGDHQNAAGYCRKISEYMDYELKQNLCINKPSLLGKI
jgi:tetratricopeptide (TPR) repeat protein